MALDTDIHGALNDAMRRKLPMERVFVSCHPFDYACVRKLWENNRSIVHPIYLLCDGLEPTTLESCVALTDGDGISYHASDPAPALHHLRQGRYVEAHVQFVPGLQVPDAPWSLDETQVAMIVEGCR
jgi:hypothetical protein